MAVALVVSNARYWLSVAPLVHRELRRWRRAADAIPDSALREQAQRKLAEAGSHAQVTATLATLAPVRARPRAVIAMVALEVLYDYLDAVGEQPDADPLHNGRQLYEAIVLAVAIDEQHAAPRWPRGDGGYAAALVAACRAAIGSLPSATAIASIARETAVCCGEAQARSHAVAVAGSEQLADWGTAYAPGGRLDGIETAAGFAASVLTLHALIAAAAEPRTSEADAARIAEAYLPVCALTTMLDSLVDRARDEAEGGHSYIAYYTDERVAAERLSAIAGEALASASSLEHPAHHAMAVCGMVAYYVSSWHGHAPLPARQLTETLRPTITPILGLFAAWRRQRAWGGRIRPTLTHLSCLFIGRWRSELVQPD